jgi:ectoine hydroxylase-related dioxygenase (phytanoyl-CoA dioxygenase family)
MEYRMTSEEDYAFDVAGYLILRNVLTSDEVSRCKAAMEDFKESSSLPDALQILRDHPVSVSCLEQLVGENAHLDSGPRILVSDGQAGRLLGGNEPREPSRSYYQQNEIRFCQGLMAVWALSDVNPDEGGLVLVPASHKSQVSAPAKLLNMVDDLRVVHQPVLRAGDLLILVESLIHGVLPWKSDPSPSLVAFEYSAEKAARSTKPKEPPPDWLDELSPEQRAVMVASDQPHAGPILKSDGQSTILEENPGVYHPSMLAPDPNCGINSTEMFLWDLCGHLVLKKVMNSDWLASANASIEACSDRIKVGGSAAKGSGVLAGTGVPSLHGLLELPKPHCDPFRKMIADPSVVQRLTWMMGSGFLLRNLRAICSVKGTSGHGLHSGADPIRPSNGYLLQNGRAYCEAINVAWQLHKVSESDGGFVCVPGSHKARYPLPSSFVTCDETMGIVHHVEMQAGDVALFLAGAQTHGAYPWRSEQDRRVVLIGYGSRNIG